MSVEYIEAANHLKGELKTFRETLQCHPRDHTALQTAQRRLQTVIAQLEPLGEDPGEAWECLSIEEKWGYVRLASFLGTAVHELRQLGINT